MRTLTLVAPSKSKSSSSRPSTASAAPPNSTFPLASHPLFANTLRIETSCRTNHHSQNYENAFYFKIALVKYTA